MKLEDAIGALASRASKAAQLHQGVVVGFAGTMPLVEIAGTTVEMVAIGDHEIGDVVQILSAGSRFVVLGTVTPGSAPNLVPNPRFDYPDPGDPAVPVNWAWDLYELCEPPPPPPPAPPYRYNTAEGGTLGATLTTGSSGGISGNAFSFVLTGSPTVPAVTYSDLYTHPDSVGLSVKVDRTVSGADSQITSGVGWSNLPDLGAWAEVYCTLTLTSYPDSDWVVLLSALHASLWLAPDGELRLYNTEDGPYTAGPAAGASLGTALPLEQSVTLALRITFGVGGEGRLRYWSAPSTAEADPDDELILAADFWTPDPFFPIYSSVTFEVGGVDPVPSIGPVYFDQMGVRAPGP